METEPPSLFLTHILIVSNSPIWIVLNVLFLLILLLASALISGSEIAFFSINSKDIVNLSEESSKASKLIINLLEKPRKLLATILISNNLVNIGIVILSTFVLDQFFSQTFYEQLGKWFVENISAYFHVSEMSNFFNLLINVVAVTFLLVLFGEVAPKIYANFNSVNFAKFMSRPLYFLNKIFGPISNVLVNWTTFLEKKLGDKGQKKSIKEDIDQAIELTISNVSYQENEADILRGILNFSDLMVRQIMCPRTDVVGFEKNGSYSELISTIKDSSYSRIPIFEDDFDNVVGILYIKDLISHLEENEAFDWTPLIRKDLLYVPELKKVNELLKEFQQRRMHMAIVVDEYGGSSGIVTLEDVMEEIVGEIRDEFDEDEDVEYVKIDDSNYIFDGKTNLQDAARIIGLDVSVFEDSRGDADTLAGLMLEILEFIPKVDREIQVNNLKLKVVSVNKKRIEKISILIT